MPDPIGLEEAAARSADLPACLPDARSFPPPPPNTQPPAPPQVFPDAPTAISGQRFLDLAVGKEGVGYKKSKFELVMEGSFIQSSGVKSLRCVYVVGGAGGRVAVFGGSTVEQREGWGMGSLQGPTGPAMRLLLLLAGPRVLR